MRGLRLAALTLALGSGLISSICFAQAPDEVSGQTLAIAPNVGSGYNCGRVSSPLYCYGLPVTVSGQPSGTLWLDTYLSGTNAGRYPASSGYDMSTGLGSPNAGALVAAMCAHAVQVRSPTISGVSVSSLRRARPKLQFTAVQGQNAPALKRLVVRLPNGLRFAKKLKHITVIGPRGNRALYRASLRSGLLTITLNNSKSQVKVTISYDTLTATKRLVTAARRRRAGKLKISVAATDTVSHSTQLAAAVYTRS